MVYKGRRERRIQRRPALTIPRKDRAVATNPLPSIDVLRQLLHLDEATCKLFWKERPRSFFKTDGECRRWNGRYAGKEAFSGINARGYKYGMLFKRGILAHHVIWALRHGYWPKSIDHESGFKADNTDGNIRNVPQAINNRNTARRKDNASGHPGVNFDNKNNKWLARIGIGDGRRKIIGWFANVDDAINAKKAAEISYGYHRNHGRG